MSEAFKLRPYRESDEDASITLWLETWRQAYPSINFDARVDWWRNRWRTELVPVAQIVVAEQDGALVGFVTIDGRGYLDQLVVSPAQWGSDVSRTLVDETKRLSPTGVRLKVNADNIRAIKFYMRNGFVKTGDEVNTSGRAVDLMEWKP
ncbi:GNAT family N-acetyltransferase [Tardiphaga robiniae]|uniref:GCN5 family acetyltransferase n=1 Tax=Tardiphaga robiniae TaxID=943830 RepID=A0A163YQB0_9BRAD|nr:GNAT family N-acetyltransferase [Tardiphaga robiniae]KZD22423.1 GCN5 family acetyltransferase [Tardiphaga robiniae]